jgi:hypothetical protein
LLKLFLLAFAALRVGKGSAPCGLYVCMTKRKVSLILLYCWIDTSYFDQAVCQKKGEFNACPGFSLYYM